MSRDVNELSGRDITDLACVRRVRAGLLAVDVARLRELGDQAAGTRDLRASGIVKAGFVVDQSMYDDGRYE